MANQKVSQLTAATTPLAGTELAYVVQSGASRKATVQDIANKAPGTDLSYTAASRLLASSTGADVTLPVATATDAGLESAADKSKLDSITVDRATLTVSLVRNTTGSTIAKGTPVYVTGSSGVTKLVAPADASVEATAANTLGVTQEAIAHNSTGYVVTEGELSGIDTSALTEGALIFLSETTGAITSTRPTQPAHGVVLGWCIKTGAGTSGIIYVKVDNGLELNELHDVLITSPATGQVLRRASDGLWKNTALVASDVAGLSGTNTGDVSLAASVTDVLNLSGQELQADDPGADRLLFWDDSAGKLTHLTAGAGLTITGTTIDATGATDLGYTASTRLLTSSTGADVTLPLFSSTEAGLVGASGGGTANFLRADGTWATPASGDITAVTAGTGLSGGGTSGDVTLNLANTAVSAGSYTYASITVDAQGRLTGASSGTAPVTSVTGTAPISSSGGTTPAISISAATTSAAGSMSAADKTKLDGIESGAQVNVATNLTYTASTRALDSSTGTDVTLPLFDTASANAGLVPGSSTGGTANFLRADGTWAAPPATAPGGSTTQIQFNDAGSFAGDADLTWNKTTNLLTTKGDISLDDGGTYTTTLQTVTPTAARTISLPDATGTVALVAGSSGQVIYNNAGANAGISTLTVDGSGNLTLTGRLTNSYTSIASSPAKTFTGTWFTGGTSTTTKPHVLIEPSGATSTAWSTSGTGLGVNAASGFTGRLLDLQLNGTSNFNVDSTGRISVPLGTAALPSIYPGTDTNTGIWSPAADTVSIATGGTERFQITSAGLVHLGNGATAASPSAATLSATGGTGSNIAGAALTVRGGVSTGSAAGGSVILQTTPAGSAGSSANTSTTRLTIDSTGLFTFADAINLAVGTTTGTKIGTATTQKLGFFNATPVVQPAAVADITTTATTGTLPTPDGTVTIADAATPTVAELLEYCVELEAKLETALSRLRTLGLIAP